MNQSPYEQGWMIRLRVTDANGIGALLDAAAYQAHVASEQH